jgi:hypothetical protein
MLQYKGYLSIEQSIDDPLDDDNNLAVQPILKQVGGGG